MNCENIKEGMSLYIDGALSETETIEFKEHIKNCKNCKIEMEQMLDVIDGLRSLPEIELPENFHNEIMNTIKKESKNNTQINETRDYGYKKSGYKALIYKNWRALSGIAVAACFVFIIYSVGSMKVGSAKSSNQEMAKSDGYGGDSKYTSDNSTLSLYSGALAGAAPEATMGSARDQVEQETSAATSAQRATEDESKILKTEDSVENDLDKKIIKTANVSLQIYDFDGVMQYLKNIAVQSGGYVENSNSYIRYTDPEKNINLKSGVITIKVPSEIYDSVVASTTSLGNVIQNNEFIDDVTSNYIDTESLLKAKRLEEQRLLAIMEKAETIEDLILLEQRLSTVRGDLEVYTGKINNWDRLVKFSTVVVNLEQIKQLEGTEISPNTLVGRMKKSFIYSIDNIRNKTGDLVVWAAQTLPIVIVLAIISGFVFLAFKIFKKRKNKKLK